MDPKPDDFIWLDLEMTGLNPERDKIIEIATVVTNKDLEIIAVGPELAIHQPDYIINNMDVWNTTQHNKSGLIIRARESKINEATAEQLTIDFLKKYVAAGASPMCGNTIYQDRRFLNKYMPTLETYFHYRNLDVSSLKILAQAWAPEVYNKIKKSASHRAMDDIIESIEELKFYRKHLLKNYN